MNKISIIYILLLAFGLFIGLNGCQREYDSRLVESEFLMEEFPDSALSILESIDASKLTSDSDKALYGLLLTQALDKNHLEPTNDSLISASSKYFEEKEDEEHLIVAYYYQGRVFHHLKNNPKALVSFFKAKNVGESIDSPFLVSMACRGISDIYNTSFNSSEELKYAQLEYDFMKKSGRQPYLNYTILDLCRAFVNNDKTDEAFRITKQLADSAKKYGDDYLDFETLRLIERSYHKQKNYDNALKYAKTICENAYAQSEDTLNLALLMMDAGLANEGKSLMERVSQLSPMAELYMDYKYLLQSKNYREAIEYSRKVDSVSACELRMAINQNLMGTLADYLELKNKVHEANAKTAKAYAWIGVLSFLVILAIVLTFTIRKYRQQNQQIADKVSLAEQLQESLDNSNALLDERSMQLDESNVSKKEILSKIEGVMLSKYSMLNKLSLEMYSGSDSHEIHRRIADKLNEIIKDFTLGEEGLSKLEKELDDNCDNLMRDLRIDLPGLKEQDYNLFMFSSLHFSIPVITMLLKEDKIESVYNRKRRLKIKINNLDTSKKDRYLKHLV